MEVDNVCMVAYDINKKIRGGARTMTLDFEVDDSHSHSVTIDTDYMGLDYTACDYGDALYQDLNYAVREVLADKELSDLDKPEIIEAIKVKIENNWYGSGAYKGFTAPTTKDNTIRPKKLRRALKYA